MRACFQAELRQPTNRNGLKSLRREGRLPGIIMSPNEDTTMIHVALKSSNAGQETVEQVCLN